MHFCEWTLPILINISLYFVLHFTKGGSQWFNWPVTVKITGPRTTAGKTHVWPVHLLYIIMFKIRKSKPNSDSKAQKFSPWLIDSVGSGNGSCKIPPLTGIEQEWHLKRLNTLGGLEIGIQHQIVNTLELSNPPPPPPPPPTPPTTSLCWGSLCGRYDNSSKWDLLSSLKERKVHFRIRPPIHADP